MNVFVLSTGRCGSVSFAEACRHITNFSSGHETRLHLVGEERLAYPERHIEADNRLSWFLGRLDRHYGDDAFYVHLTRDAAATGRSFERRAGRGIMSAYAQGVIVAPEPRFTARQIADDLVDTVTANIELFLRNKTRVMKFSLENAEVDFPAFWERVGAEGDLGAAIASWRTPHNAHRRRITGRAVAHQIRAGYRRAMSRLKAA